MATLHRIEIINPSHLSIKSGHYESTENEGIHETLAYFVLAHKVGSARILRKIFKPSPVDMALLDDPDIMQAVSKGAPPSFPPRLSSHENCMSELAAFVTDWRASLLSSKAPVVLINGDRSPFTPIETARDFARRSQNIRLVEAPGVAQLVIYQRPDLVLDEVCRAMA